MGLERAYTINKLKKKRIYWRERSSQFIQRNSIDASELRSVPKMFGRTIGGYWSKQCEGPPFSCRHRLLFSREQGVESWQLLLRNLRGTFNVPMGLLCLQHPLSFSTCWVTSEDYFLYLDGFLVKAQAEMSNYRFHSACIHTYIHTYIELAFWYLFQMLLSSASTVADNFFYSCSLSAAFNSFILCFLPAWTDLLGRWEGGGKVTQGTQPLTPINCSLIGLFVIQFSWA